MVHRHGEHSRMWSLHAIQRGKLWALMKFSQLKGTTKIPTKNISEFLLQLTSHLSIKGDHNLWSVLTISEILFSNRLLFLTTFSCNAQSLLVTYPSSHPFKSGLDTCYAISPGQEHWVRGWHVLGHVYEDGNVAYPKPQGCACLQTLTECLLYVRHHAKHGRYNSLWNLTSAEEALLKFMFFSISTHNVLT